MSETESKDPVCCQCGGPVDPEDDRSCMTCECGAYWCRAGDGSPGDGCWTAYESLPYGTFCCPLCDDDSAEKIMSDVAKAALGLEFIDLFPKDKQESLRQAKVALLKLLEDFAHPPEVGVKRQRTEN